MLEHRAKQSETERSFTGLAAPEWFLAIQTDFRSGNRASCNNNNNHAACTTYVTSIQRETTCRACVEYVFNTAKWRRRRQRRRRRRCRHHLRFGATLVLVPVIVLYAILCTAFSSTRRRWRRSSVSSVCSRACPSGRQRRSSSHIGQPRGLDAHFEWR